jgi:hypothetical protein
MSIHKKDIEDLIESYSRTIAKGNTSAVNLIPHMIRSLIAYVEEATGKTPPTTVPEPKSDSKIAVMEPAPVSTAAPVPAEPEPAPALSGEDKAFAQGVAAQNLTENGNATVETDVGNHTVEVAADAAPAEIEAAAQEVVADAEEAGATEVTAVTTKPGSKKKS